MVAASSTLSKKYGGEWNERGILSDFVGAGANHWNVMCFGLCLWKQNCSANWTPPKWGQRNISTSQPNVLQKTPCFLWGCWAEALVRMLWVWGWAQCCLGRCRMLLAEMLFEVPLPCFTKCRCAQKDISTLTRGENVYAIGKAVAVPSSATLWLWASCSTPQYSNLPPVVLHR